MVFLTSLAKVNTSIPNHPLNFSNETVSHKKRDAIASLSSLST
jgi:hypothetical protein